MKKLLSVVIIISVMIALSIPSKAASTKDMDIPISITVNDKYIYSDVDPFLQGGTTFVPVRFVSEALGVDSVQWDHKNKTAVIKEGNLEIKLPVWQNYAYINGKKVDIRSGVKLVNNRTFVPIRFVSETLGADVWWNQSTYTVKIYKEGITVPKSAIYNRGYTDDDLYWLSRIVEAEASGESMKGKIGVANVILNRKESDEFPNTIWGVIFDTKYGIQFTPVANGRIYNTPSSESIIAAKIALEGGNTVGDSLYFFNPVKAKSSWIAYNRPYYTTIGNHKFYL